MLYLEKNNSNRNVGAVHISQLQFKESNDYITRYYVRLLVYKPDVYLTAQIPLWLPAELPFRFVS